MRSLVRVRPCRRARVTPPSPCAMARRIMRFSRALIPTMKEAPADAANVSQVLLARGGFVRRVELGSSSFIRSERACCAKWKP